MNAKLFHFIPFLFMLHQPAKGQDISSRADSLYAAKNYSGAAVLYNKVAAISEFRTATATNYYNAACCYALIGKKDSAYYF